MCLWNLLSILDGDMTVYIYEYDKRFKRAELICYGNVFDIAGSIEATYLDVTRGVTKVFIKDKALGILLT